MANARYSTAPPEHDPRCAVVRSGDIRAWCDCGAEAPVLNEIRANVAETIGRGLERGRIVRWIRKNADDIIGKACAGRADPVEMELITLTLETLADMLEEGAHRDDD